MNITPHRCHSYCSKQIARLALAFFACSLLLMVTACQGSIPILVASSPTPADLVVEESSPEYTKTQPTQENTAEIPAEQPEDTPTPEEISIAATATATRTMRPTASSTITPGPSPTATRTATRTPTATRTRWPTITNTITLSPTPPAAVMRISRPGLLSKVSSPFRVEAVIKTGDDGKAWLHLIGEDGRIITEQKLDFGRQANQRFSVSPEVIFEIAGAAETGRLMISSLDSYGRTISLSSVDLILMKAGGDEINPPILYWEPYLVRSPKNEAVISGGTVLVSGMIRPVNENPVIFELIDTAGRVIAASEMIIAPPSGDFSHTPFQLGIPYRVNQSTPARLVLRQESDGRISGTVALWSMVLTLEP
jgi:hypothetical protein